jgi:hypothetical protein
MKHYIFHALEWRKTTPQRSTRKEKLINILRSCKNARQLNAAWKFASSVSKNSLEREELAAIFKDHAINGITDLTATLTTVKDRWKYEGMFVYATGYIDAREGMKADRVVFIPEDREISVKNVNFLQNV